MTSIFDNLVIFEMANNHQGSVDHALRIVAEMGKIARNHQLNAAVKLQYRDLDSFIHPDFKGRSDVKHVPRFESTRLESEQFQTILEAIREEGLRTVVTPFDEVSVGRIVDHGVEIAKVASCSAKDWPLIEAMVATRKPIICSTGGLSIYDIDKLVSFFTHHKAEFAILHCVAIYPTPEDKFNLDFLSRLQRRYPAVPIGYSGHEAPDNILVGQLAVTKGATLLERHVGVPTDEISLNKYSMNPNQVDDWLSGIKQAWQLCGSDQRPIGQIERDSLQSLRRGVVAKKDLAKGEELTVEDVCFAFPAVDGQLTSGEFGQIRATYITSKDYKAGESIMERSKPDTLSQIRGIIHDAKGTLFEAGVHLGKEYEVELSHHYGIDHFRQTGATILNIINREYCKKIIIMLPGQKHPNHHHKKKEETFQILWGDLQVIRNADEEFSLGAGDLLLVERNATHRFTTTKGVVFEEISSTHYRNDSYYEDPEIAKLDPMERKTVLESW